jgi:hypothetical protein
MPILSDQKMAQFSDWIERNVLKDDCTILDPITGAQTPSGGRQVSYTARAQTVKCALLDDQGSPNEQMVAAQQVGSVTQFALFPRGTVFNGNERLQIKGITYHVVDPLGPTTYEVTRRVLVRRASIQGGS